MEPFSPSRVACMPAGCCHAVQRTSETARECMAAVPWRSWSDLDMARTLRPESFDGRGRPRRISPRVRLSAQACGRLTTLCYHPTSSPAFGKYNVFVFAPAVSRTHTLCSAPSMHACHLVHVCLHFKCPGSKPRKAQPPSLSLST